MKSGSDLFDHFQLGVSVGLYWRFKSKIENCRIDAARYWRRTPLDTMTLARPSRLVAIDSAVVRVNDILDHCIGIKIVRIDYERLSVAEIRWESVVLHIKPSLH